MIDRIEALPLADSPGIVISIYYDTDCMDSFSVFSAEHAQVILDLMQCGRPPEDVLIAIRDCGRFPLH